MITSVRNFIKYFDGIRRRTMNFIEVIPADHVDWAPNENEFTVGDLLRHLGSTEKMFVGVVTEGHWNYGGHEPALGQSLADLKVYLEQCHTEAMGRLERMDDGGLVVPRPSLDGPKVKAWRFLMAMVEHEIHHRSQLAMYLTLMETKPPQLYGLGIDDVIELSEKMGK